ncbi:MAG TPA: pilus assembly PilX N-terminal domain-containing protein [Vicinamibacterales bacterium]|nr:pilus assembly PilX N-terminal domain-containing protein [Vicinamibacterales bacterium]
MTRISRRLAGEEGVALIVALMATMLLTALGMTLMLLSNTETQVSANYRNSQEALYAADAGVERIVQDLLEIPRWDDILAAGTGASECAGTSSSFVDTTCGATVTGTIPFSNQTVNLIKATDNLNTAITNLNLWGTDNPTFRLFAYGSLQSMLPNNVLDTPMYVAVWIADDPADGDGNPLVDTNGTLTLHAEAYGPKGTHKVIEVTVAKTSSTEIERGQIAQRGQDELNQRARKSAVGQTGSALTNMQMSTTTGGLVVQ